MQTKQNPQTRILWKLELGNLCFFLILGVIKNGRLSAEANFAQEKNYFAIFEKTEAVSITFTQGKIPGIIDFSTWNAPDRSERDSVWIHWIAMNPLDR